MHNSQDPSSSHSPSDSSTASSTFPPINPTTGSILKKPPLRIIGNHSVSPEIAAKFRRRVLEAESTKHPPQWTKVVHGIGILLCMGFAFHSVFYEDHGTNEHIFFPIRRWYFRKLESWNVLSKHDVEELKARGKIPKDAPIAELSHA